MLTPNDIKKIEIEKINITDLEQEIDKSIKDFHGFFPWEEAIILGEYSINIRNYIGKRYKNAGWKYVYHQTSSENGERPGLTSFKFSNIPLNDKHTKTKYIEV